MMALSDSTVTSGSSSPMVSPSATLISITGTSSKPSSEGTFTTSVREPPDFFFFGAGLLSSDLASDFSSALSSGLSSSASSEPPASPLADNMPITSPSFTLSPTFTVILVILPAAGAGSSTEALSDSTVRIGSSSSTESPSLTMISMISTSSAPPRSGTLISCSLIAVSLAQHRVRFVAIDSVLAHSFENLLLLDFTVFGQGCQRGYRHVVTIHFEEAAQLLAGVTAAETVGAQGHVGFRDECPQLLGVQLDVVGRRHHRALGIFHALGHVGLAGLVVRVQMVPALHVLAVTGQFVVAGYAPHIGSHAPVFFKHLCGGAHFIHDRAGAQQLNPRALLPALGFHRLELVHALDDAVFTVFRHGGLFVVLVLDGQVVEDVLILFEHLFHTVTDYHGHFVAIGRVVRLTVRNGVRQYVAVTVLVLQAFAVQGRPAGGTADQEAAGLHVARRPGQIANALEAEHGIEHVERNQREAVGAIGRSRGHPGGHGTGFVDAFLQDLAFLVLPVVHDLVTILGYVFLAFRRVDTQLTEHAFHTESTGFVRHNGHYALADALVFDQRGQDAHEGHGGGDFTATGAFQHLLEDIQFRNLQRLAVLVTLGIEATQLLPALLHVHQLRTVRRRAVVWNVFQLFVLQRNTEAVTEGFQGVDIQLLQGVRGVLGFACRTEAITLDGVGQNHGGLAVRVVYRLVVGRVNLVRVVATTVQLLDIFVRKVFRQLGQFRMLAEELLAGIGGTLESQVLQLTVAHLVHCTLHHAVFVFLEQRIPHATPDHLDHIPAGTTEHAFQFLDNLAVAPYRAVQALQVAVNHPDQVVQLLAAGLGDRTQGFRLIALTITHKCPHLAAVHVDQLTAVQVLHDVGLVDRLDRPQTHGNGRELPVIRHQPGVRVRRQTFAVYFFAVLVQLLFTETAFQEGAGIYARRCVALEVHQV